MKQGKTKAFIKIEVNSVQALEVLQRYSFEEVHRQENVRVSEVWLNFKQSYIG